MAAAPPPLPFPLPRLDGRRLAEWWPSAASAGGTCNHNGRHSTKHTTRSGHIIRGADWRRLRRPTAARSPRGRTRSAATDSRRRSRRVIRRSENVADGRPARYRRDTTGSRQTSDRDLAPRWITTCVRTVLASDALPRARRPPPPPSAAVGPPSLPPRTSALSPPRRAPLVDPAHEITGASHAYGLRSSVTQTKWFDIQRGLRGCRTPRRLWSGPRPSSHQAASRSSAATHDRPTSSTATDRRAAPTPAPSPALATASCGRD